MLFDIVIPLGKNDVDIINYQIEYTKKNIIGYRNIYIVTGENINIDGCITIDENTFDFNLKTIEEIFKINQNRNGWYLQQLIKLYSVFSIENILENILVIDADTFFLKPTTFIENGKFLYNWGTEFHKPYFLHLSKLISITKLYPDKSGICHHMIFNKSILEEIFNKVETIHNKPFYQAFLQCVDKIEYSKSGASEYELYFNYVFLHKPEQVKLRKLNWTNTNKLSLLKSNSFDYISLHWYLRG